MPFILQVIEIPDDEVLTNRVVILSSDQISTFGSGFDCTLTLPNRSHRIAPVHGRLSINSSGHMVIDATAKENQIVVNNEPIQFGRPTRIEDGSLISIFGYTILVTGSIANPKQDGGDQGFESVEPTFSLSDEEIEEDPFSEDLVSHEDDHCKNVGETPVEESNHPFSARGVFLEDSLSNDPFADEDDGTNSTFENLLNHDVSSEYRDEESIPTAPMYHSLMQEGDTFDAPQSHHDSSDPDLIVPSQTQNVPTESFDHIKRIVRDDTHLTSGTQQRLFQILDETLHIFLDEFDPDRLQKKYLGYRKPMFGRKKYLWEMYHLDYNRRRGEKEFHRIFKAILLDRMQS